MRRLDHRDFVAGVVSGHASPNGVASAIGDPVPVVGSDPSRGHRGPGGFWL